MGFEYTLKFTYKSKEDLTAVIRKVPGFARVETKFDGYHFRSKKNHDETPNAEIRVLPDGLYFCDYGGGSEFLSELIRSILSDYNKVTVAKLEWE